MHGKLGWRGARIWRVFLFCSWLTRSQRLHLSKSLMRLSEAASATDNMSARSSPNCHTEKLKRRRPKMAHLRDLKLLSIRNANCESQNQFRLKNYKIVMVLRLERGSITHLCGYAPLERDAMGDLKHSDRRKKDKEIKQKSKERRVRAYCHLGMRRSTPLHGAAWAWSRALSVSSSI